MAGWQNLVEMTEPISSTYGATEQSPSRLSLTPVGSLDLYDAEDNEEYEYLPLPEVDEDFLDEEMAATASGRRECTFYVIVLCICSSLMFCNNH